MQCSLFNILGSTVGFFFGLAVKDSADIMKLLQYEAVFGVALAVMILLYFPDGPPVTTTIYYPVNTSADSTFCISGSKHFLF